LRGEFVALTPSAEGFTLWTTLGSLTAEYIGGDLTWRFYPNESIEHPVSAWATKRLSNGTLAYLSPRGLMIAKNAGTSSAWTEEFNEYLRVKINATGADLALWRLEYDEAEERLYVLESSDGTHFTRSFVLSITLNRWGEFSEHHFGLLRFTDGKFGYVDSTGMPRWFTNGRHIEIAPPSNKSLNRSHPRKQKWEETPSSSAVSNAYGWTGGTIPSEFIIDAAGYYEPEGTQALAPFWGPLDSEIVIGYLRPQQSAKSVDGLLELQELVLGTPARAAPTPADFTSSWNSEFYTESEDCEIMTGSEDWESLTGAEDWNGPLSSNPIVDVTLAFESSDDGITFDIVVPVMAKFNSTASLYTMLTSGTFHRLRITANTLNAYYHITYAGVTMTYGGQVI
jgi:hypothetical protein